MKTAFLAIAFLLSTVPAYAGNVYFEDGSVCKRCKAHYTSPGIVEYVEDRKGNKYYLKPGEQIIDDKHPILRAYAQGLPYAAMQFNQMQQQSYQPQPIAQPRNLSCSTLSPSGFYSSTSCYGW